LCSSYRVGQLIEWSWLKFLPGQNYSILERGQRTFGQTPLQVRNKSEQMRRLRGTEGTVPQMWGRDGPCILSPIF